MSTGEYSAACHREHVSAEGEALAAILDEDTARAIELLRAFLPGELLELRRACTELRGHCDDIWREKRAINTGGTP